MVLTRFPDGIDGKSFYQKDAPEFAPEWMRTVPIWSEETQRDIRYFVCDDEESIALHREHGIDSAAHLGRAGLARWSCRTGASSISTRRKRRSPTSIRTAQVLHRICESAELPSYVKTTGKTGLHIMLPLGRQCTYAQCADAGRAARALVLRELGDIATITRHITKRGDKVYLDYLQNRHGQTIVAPFSVRPLPGATVSMPLTVGRSELFARSEGVHDQDGARSDGEHGSRSRVAGDRTEAGSR